MLFFAFTFSEVIRLETTYGFGIMALDVLVMGGSWLWYLTLLSQKKIRRDMVSRLFFLFLACGLLGLILNPLNILPFQLAASSMYLFRYLGFGLLFFSLREEDQLKTFLHKVLLISGISILILGFLQFFLYSSLRNLFYLGWDEHLHRMFTTFLDPNFAGIFFTLFLLFLLYSLFHQLFSAKLLYILIPLTTIALLLTYSRSSYICAGVSLLILFSFEKKRKELSLFLAGVGVLFLVLLPTFFTHNTDLFRIASSVSRIDSYKEGWDIATRNVLTGVGFNTYRYAVAEYGYHRSSDVLYNHAEGGNDNSFLFVLATCGVGGLVIYIWFLYALFKSLFHGDVKGLVLSSFVVLIVASFFNHALFYTPILFWFYASLACIRQEK